MTFLIFTLALVMGGYDFSGIVETGFVLDISRKEEVVGTLHATSLRGWEKIVYYSYLMRHDVNL
ncbi:hypothetical protein [Dapis sp. BLCC M229]|uniref:hypothetical protein n=1 Tax=Dapis sp. BLCC M229 TaxID=3400188 RepID=UPI003CED6FDC